MFHSPGLALCQCGFGGKLLLLDLCHQAGDMLVENGVVLGEWIAGQLFVNNIYVELTTAVCVLWRGRGGGGGGGGGRYNC